MSGAAAAAPEPLVLVVPNFSEGRRAEVMDPIVAAMTSVPGITLLNRQSDPDHNRLDTTLIGSPEAARAAAMAGAAKAVELIDMEQHHGSHPRMGAVDVIPFIPIRGVTMDDCVELARNCARELAETLSLPVYLYERAASTPERASLADVRRGEYEGLRADVAEGRRLPDMGPHQLGKAGATAVGARPPLVAFNVYLVGSDERAAKEVAKRVRERSGGLVHVRAIGFAVPERGCVQVSMNLLDPLATPPYRALELVRLEAARFGMQVLDTEIVGLIPQAALAESAAHYLQLRGFKPDAQVIETLVASHGSGVAAVETPAAPPGADGESSSPPADSGIGTMTVDGFLEALASARPTPGGGGAATMSPAAGAALLAMVARLTSGRKGYEALEGRMAEVAALADAERAALTAFADQDAAARAAAVQSALTGAAEVPLKVARRAAALLATARELVETGNANAVSDAYSAGQLLHTAVAGALANVSVNLAAMSDSSRTDVLQSDAQRVRRGAAAQLAAVETAFASRLSGTA